MDIFESLENLNVSEECFDDIMGIVEEIINEVSDRKIRKCSDIKKDRSKILSKIVDNSRNQIDVDNKEGKEFIDTLDTFAKQDEHRSEVLKDKLGSRVQVREEKKKN